MQTYWLLLAVRWNRANCNPTTFLQGDVEEDEAIPDKEWDIKPRFHKTKTHLQKRVEDSSHQQKRSEEEEVGWFSVSPFAVFAFVGFGRPLRAVITS